jgi:hypothetical protein
MSIYGDYARKKDLKGIVRVNYVGEQDNGKGSSFSLYNLLEEMGEYPKGSTLSEATIHKQGYAYVVMNVYDTMEEFNEKSIVKWRAHEKGLE